MRILAKWFDMALDFIPRRYLIRFVSKYDQNKPTDPKIQIYQRLAEGFACATEEQVELYKQALIIYEAKNWSLDRFNIAYTEFLKLSPLFEYQEVYKRGAEDFLENGWPLEYLTEIAVKRVRDEAGAQILSENIAALKRVENVILDMKKPSGEYCGCQVLQHAPEREYALRCLLEQS